MDASVLPRDVDATTALALLQELAAATGAAVYDTPDGTVVYQALSGRAWPVFALRWRDFDRALTWDLVDPDLTWSGPQPSWEQASPEAERPLTIPCEVIEWEPVWESTESAVINEIRVGYGAADAGAEQPSVRLSDQPSIDRHGRRYLSLATELATQADATARAGLILTTQARERWSLGSVVVDLADLGRATRKQVIGLTCGRHVIVAGLPQPAPAVAWSGIVEGWTYTQDDAGSGPVTRMTLSLSDPAMSLATFPWSASPIAYTWDEHPRIVTWDDLNNLEILN
jgi:hypothetical protein